jgi:hypothetical protein
MSLPVAKGKELLSDLTHSGMEASIDAGGAVDLESAETCALKRRREQQTYQRPRSVSVTTKHTHGIMLAGEMGQV